jgi:DNA-binding response OmpR family regulator
VILSLRLNKIVECIFYFRDDKGCSILNQALEEEGYLASVASDALKGFERLKNTFNLIVEDWMPQK